jgi:hypothetical protein
VVQARLDKASSVEAALYTQAESIVVVGGVACKQKGVEIAQERFRGLDCGEELCRGGMVHPG